MTNEIVKQKLIDQFGDVVSNFSETYGILTFEVACEQNLKVLNFLNDDPSLGFTYLNDLTAIHYPDQKGKELAVVYLLQNIPRGAREYG